jgi:hypothetical protein
MPREAACGRCYFWQGLHIGYGGKGGWCLAMTKPSPRLRKDGGAVNSRVMTWIAEWLAPAGKSVWPLTHCDMVCDQFVERRKRDANPETSETA